MYDFLKAWDLNEVKLYSYFFPFFLFYFTIPCYMETFWMHCLWQSCFTFFQTKHQRNLEPWVTRATWLSPKNNKYRLYEEYISNCPKLNINDEYVGNQISTNAMYSKLLADTIAQQQNVYWNFLLAGKLW